MSKRVRSGSKTCGICGCIKHTQDRCFKLTLHGSMLNMHQCNELSRDLVDINSYPTKPVSDIEIKEIVVCPLKRDVEGCVIQERIIYKNILYLYCTMYKPNSCNEKNDLLVQVHL